MSKNQHSRNNFAPKVVPPTPPYDATDKHRHRSSRAPQPNGRNEDTNLPLILGVGCSVVLAIVIATLAVFIPVISPNTLPAETHDLLNKLAVGSVLIMVVILAVGVGVMQSRANPTIETTKPEKQPHHSVAHEHNTNQASDRSRDETEIAHNAQHAVVRAGHNLTRTPLLLDDIGVIAYHDSIHPRIVRNSSASTDSTHIRPFVIFTPRSEQEVGRVTVSFSLLDEQGITHYTSRAVYTLKQGQNFIAPNTWLPLAGTPIGSGKWSLHVSLNDQPPLAIHRFGWHKPVELQFGSDGEIDQHTRKLIKQHLALADDEPLSLDDLLAEQHGSATAKNQ